MTLATRSPTDRASTLTGARMQSALGTTVRARFPALAAADEVYLDSASTTQKPISVISAVDRYHTSQTANAGRGTYTWANQITRELGRIRARTAAFIGADADEVIFTAGATAALNAVALAWGLRNLEDGDEILFHPRDHASNVYPWHRLAGTLARFGVRITLVPYSANALGEVDIADILAKISPRTRLITVSHLHHTFGALSTLEELRGRLDESVLLCFDCSQSAGHIPVDVRVLGADFAVLSAHKMFGSPGTGVLYCRRRVHDMLDPFLPGGQSGVSLSQGELHTTGMPDLLEGGTPNIPGILALGAALLPVGWQSALAHWAQWWRQISIHACCAELPSLPTSRYASTISSPRTWRRRSMISSTVGRC